MRKRSQNKKELKDGKIEPFNSSANEVLIRRVLNEELEVRNYVTKEFLFEELERRNYVTKEFLFEELERRDYVTKDYLREEMTIQRKEYERYVGSLAEDFQSKLDAVIEVVVATAEDMTDLKRWIKEDHYNTHTTINSRLNALEGLARPA